MRKCYGQVRGKNRKPLDALRKPHLNLVPSGPLVTYSCELENHHSDMYIIDIAIGTSRAENHLQISGLGHQPGGSMW